MSDLTTRIQRYADSLMSAYPDVTASEVMTVRRAPVRLRPVLVAAAAALIVLLAIGGFALLLDHSDRPVVGSTTLPAPTSTLVPTTGGESTTTTGPTTTTTEAAAPLPVITWTRIEDPVFDGPTDQSLISVKHIGSAFYVVGNDLENKSGVIWRSEDGYTWERFDDLDVFGGPPGVHGIYDIVGNDSVIVALGYEGNEDDLGDVDHPPYGSPEAWCRGVVWVSEDDGHTWTRLSHEEAFGTEDGFCELKAISTSNGFLAAYHGVWTSQDGLHWTQAAVLSDDGVITDLASTPFGFVGVGFSWTDGQQAAAWWSTDGVDWTPVSDEDGQFQVALNEVSKLYGVVATDNGLVAVGTVGRSDQLQHFEGAVWLSGNGHTWRRQLDPELNGYHQEIMRDITKVGNLLIAVGESSNYPGYWPQPLPGSRSIGVVWISEDDGATWHRMDNPDRVFGLFVGDWISIRSITSFGGRLVAAGYDGEGVAVWVGTIEEGEGP